MNFLPHRVEENEMMCSNEWNPEYSSRSAPYNSCKYLETIALILKWIL